MTVVDGVCPLMTDPDSWDGWIEGGVDIAVPTVANWEGLLPRPGICSTNGSGG